MQLPEKLLKIAALGTEQHPVVDRLEVGTLNKVLDQIDNQSSEAALLLLCAGMTLRQQAGYQPVQVQAFQVNTAASDHAPPCGAKSVRHLLLMLAGIHQSLLPVWLYEMSQSGFRLPEEILPLLLDFGSDNVSQQHMLIGILGDRGRWLAQTSQNAKWRWAYDSLIEQDWYEDGDEAWIDYFQRFRERDPRAACDLLEAFWPKLVTKLKLQLIRVMKIGLGNHDEDFLIERLQEDDWVSTVAARLLTALPGSAFGMQMVQTVEAMLRLKRMGHRKQWVIDFVWSSAFTTHSQQRALARVSTFSDQWTPEQMLSFVPLSYWYEQWSVTPDILIEGARNSTRPEVLLEAWTQMAVFEEDRSFALELLCRVHPNRINQKWRLLLIDLLTPQQIEQVGIYWLDRIRSGIHVRHPIIPLLETHDERWSDELMVAFLASLERGFTETVRPLLIRSIRSFLMRVVPYFSLEMIDEVKRVLKLNKRTELSESELDVIDEIVAVLDFQQEMIQAIRKRED